MRQSSALRLIFQHSVKKVPVRKPSANWHTLCISSLSPPTPPQTLTMVRPLDARPVAFTEVLQSLVSPRAQGKVPVCECSPQQTAKSARHTPSGMMEHTFDVE